MNAAYSWERDKRITQLQYFLQPFGELPRISIPRTPVNSARTRGAHRRDVSHDIEVEANYRGTNWPRRYNALPNAPTDRSGWVWKRTESRTRTGRSGCCLQTTTPCSGRVSPGYSPPTGAWRSSLRPPTTQTP